MTEYLDEEMLNKDIIQAVEYMCGNELNIGYVENNIKDISTDINEKIVKFLLKDLNSTSNWSSAIGDTPQDIGLELTKKVFKFKDLDFKDDFINKTFLLKNFSKL